MQEIARALSRVRGQDFIRPVQPKLLTRAELADYLSSHVHAEDLKQLALDQELYRVLGLIGPSVELYPLYQALLEEQVVGLFDLDSEELLVVTDSLPLAPSTRVTLAHELDHALQQQHFNAGKLEHEATGKLDQELALTALLEGDATFAMGLYAIASLTPTELQDLGNNLTGSPVFDSAPPVIRKTFTFPYDDGARFVAALWQRTTSWRRVDQAYVHLPASTEQVLHPTKYFVDEGPRPVSLPPLLPILGNGWETVWEDTLGEFVLRTYLETALDNTTAASAAAGWGGDRFSIWRNAVGQRVFTYLAEWDTPADAQEFFTDYQKFADATGNWDTKHAGAKVVRWGTPGRSALLALAEGRTLLVLAPDGETAAKIASAFPQFEAEKVPALTY